MEAALTGTSFRRPATLLGTLFLATVLTNGAPQDLGAALTFHASFDNGPDADFGLGDKRIHTAPSYKNLEAAQVGLHNPAVAIVAKGRFGSALEFKAKNTAAIFYPAEKNVDYKQSNWSGTVSFWLNLNPDEDLTGFADPIQLTDKDYNDAALWVDFTGNDKPRHVRLGVFGDLKAWNPDNVRGQTNPAFLRHIVAVTTHPFARGTWTHVAFTFAGLNGQSGVAKFFLNGKLQGNTEPLPDPFTWDISRAKIRIGVNYAGLLDEVSIFNRALSESEVQTLFGLAAGVTNLRR
jgi:Concanavalin A-like lectin/glucanases superfamily